MNLDIHQALGIISGLIAFFALVPYFISVIKNKSRPHPISWAMWALMGVISLGTYWGTGARDTIYIAFVNFLNPLIVTFLSIKYWDWKKHFSRLEYTCFVLSIVSVVIWLCFQNPTAALTFNLIADLIAAIPTLIKTYKNPSSEDTKTWLLFVIANFLSLVAIQQWTYGIALLPAYLFCFAFVVLILSLRKTNLKIP